MTKPDAGIDGDTSMKLTVAGHPEFSEREYSHVVSTIPLSCLRTVDTEKCNLTYLQKMALRSLNYGSGVKVGIKFKTRWWKKVPEGLAEGGEGWPKVVGEGGVSSTDRQSRVVVYPSYGVDDPEDKPGVLIAAYNW